MKLHFVFLWSLHTGNSFSFLLSASHLRFAFRMDGKLADSSYIGDINLSTQLVNVDEIEMSANDPMSMDDIYRNRAVEATVGPSGNTVSQTSNIGNTKGPASVGLSSPDRRRLFIRTKSVELGTGQVLATLFRTSPSNCWWPMKILAISSKPIASGHYHGFVLLNPFGLMVKAVSSMASPINPNNLSLAPSVGEIFDNCVENKNGIVMIPYSQVQISACLFLPFAYVVFLDSINGDCFWLLSSWKCSH
jgi:hypothetical protein